MYALDDLESIGYGASPNATGYATASDLDGEQWAMIGLGALATAAVGALIYAAATSEPGEYAPREGFSDDDATDWLLNPANPASPLFPLNPANPASPLWD